MVLAQLDHDIGHDFEVLCELFQNLNKHHLLAVRGAHVLVRYALLVHKVKFFWDLLKQIVFKVSFSCFVEGKGELHFSLT